MIRTRSELSAALAMVQARLASDPQTLAEWTAIFSHLAMAARYAKQEKKAREGEEKK